MRYPFAQHRNKPLTDKTVEEDRVHKFHAKVYRTHTHAVIPGGVTECRAGRADVRARARQLSHGLLYICMASMHHGNQLANKHAVSNGRLVLPDG